MFVREVVGRVGDKEGGVEMRLSDGLGSMFRSAGVGVGADVDNISRGISTNTNSNICNTNTENIKPLSADTVPSSSTLISKSLNLTLHPQIIT